ncbi:MAG: hypothetical protein B7O98_02755 [Zestosphaera tikiterensis]|uniref:Uncharacterized protein n=1 Tax=Zestosphaera tikiterensis TaxID=1973259 RepID=A0A2R7Y754_9CREN|nr:MAG: hypothetical protein B7O98_02755 [Zestosphaera tikiterensis]
MRKIINDLKQSGIDACSLQDLILEIVKYADEWRSEMIKRGVVKGNTKPTLPEMLYMLKLVEYMKDAEMIS